MEKNSKKEHSACNHVAEGFPQLIWMRTLTVLEPLCNLVLMGTELYILYFVCIINWPNKINNSITKNSH
jgi:hypothetical protein